MKVCGFFLNDLFGFRKKFTVKRLGFFSLLLGTVVVFWWGFFEIIFGEKLRHSKLSNIRTYKIVLLPDVAPTMTGLTNFKHCRILGRS
jgi:hypothetical protein